MKEESVAIEIAEVDKRASWLAMTIIGLGQALMTFNVSALPVSMSGFVASFDVAPTTVGTVIVVHSLSIAAFVMLGAKLGQIFGSKNVFRVSCAVYAVAMTMMTLAHNLGVVFAAQVLAGLAASAAVPTFVALIANSYKGKQQVEALGLLGGIQALAGMMAFFLAGALDTLASWRITFALLIPWALAVVFLSRYLMPLEKIPEIKIDWFGALLVACAVIFISLGFNNLNYWGILLAKPNIPFQPAGLSPAPVMIVLGVVLIQSFFGWSHRRAAKGKTPLLALQVIESPPERAAVLAMLVIVGLGKALTFLMPLYTEIIQGRTSLPDCDISHSVPAGGVCCCGVDCALVRHTVAAADRSLFLYHRRRRVRGSCRKVSERVERHRGHFASHRDRHRSGGVGDAPFQRVGDLFAQAIRRRRRFSAWHDHESGRCRRYRNCRSSYGQSPDCQHGAQSDRPPNSSA